MKQTRLAAEGNAPFPYVASQPPMGMYPQASAPSPAKSNAKLMIGIAAAVLVVVVGAAVVLLTIAKKPPVAASAPASQPAQSTAPSASPPAAPTAAGAGQPSIAPQVPPQTAPQGELAKPAGDNLSTSPVQAGENSNSVKGARTARKETSADAAARKEKERKAAEARRLLNQ
jgi:hypothetical protein